MKPIKVRALYRAVKVSGQAAPYDTLTLKVFYPARYGDSFEERNTGFIPVDDTRAPFPVVIIMPGINVPHESYSWLARELAGSGFVVVSYSWVAMEMADLVSISPGVHIKRLTKKHYGRKPSCPALPAIFSELKRLNKNGLLAGHLNLSRVVLGGHSAGGTMALLNANADWFPSVCGAFSYGAHTGGNVALGWEEGSIMPLAKDLPLLIMGGTRDGVIANSAHRYGDETQASPTERIERSFHEGIKGKRGDRYLVLIEGANHFSMVWPRDKSTGRPFLDKKSKGSNKAIRKFMAKLVVTFCDQVSSGSPMSTADLQALADDSHPMVALAEHK
ncbi:MAG: hypothetical protein ABJ308_03485 [Halieaceae bacterium]